MNSIRIGPLCARTANGDQLNGLGGGGGLVRLQAIQFADDRTSVPSETVSPLPLEPTILKAVGGTAAAFNGDLERSFRREVGFYGLIDSLSLVKKLAVPVCYLALPEPPAAVATCEEDPGFSIVLEDLSLAGYSTASMDAGLTLPQVKAVLTELARFHAAFWPSSLSACPPTEGLTIVDLAKKHDKYCTPHALAAFVDYYCRSSPSRDLAGFKLAQHLVWEHGAGRLLQLAVEQLGGDAITLNHGDVHPLNLMFHRSSATSAADTSAPSSAADASAPSSAADTSTATSAADTSASSSATDTSASSSAADTSASASAADTSAPSSAAHTSAPSSAAHTSAPSSAAHTTSLSPSIDLRLVDFADIAWTTPAYDVQQCIACCLEASVRREHEAGLLLHYSDVLVRERQRLQAQSDAAGNISSGRKRSTCKIDSSWDRAQFGQAVRAIGALSALQIAGWFGAEAARAEAKGGERTLLDCTASPLAARLVAMVADGAAEIQGLPIDRPKRG
jgi:hypothetical protein